jgi:hypothetical protein
MESLSKIDRYVGARKALSKASLNLSSSYDTIYFPAEDDRGQ